MGKSRLAKNGWKPIVSDKQASQLLRHELKHHAAWQQRVPGYVWDVRRLLAFKRGNWFKFIRNRENGCCSIMIWNDPTD